jgi:hypothetical protein
MPVDSSGYEIEILSEPFTACCCRENRIYFGTADGKLYMADEDDDGKGWIFVGRPFTSGFRCIFVSRRGSLFASSDGLPLEKNERLLRSVDGGKTWRPVIETGVWRMAQDAFGNVYAGNYVFGRESIATLYKSEDDGKTWKTVFRDKQNHHIHTVRVDETSVYIAFGDTAEKRGQAFSPDGGASWQMLAQGPEQGHTDAVITEAFVFWGSDSKYGAATYRYNRRTKAEKVVLRGGQYVWWLAADTVHDIVYFGTMTARKTGGEKPVIMASRDQGRTWQKLMELGSSSRNYEGFRCCSREVSKNGWLYAGLTGDRPGIRIRRRTVGSRDQAARGASLLPVWKYPYEASAVSIRLAAVPTAEGI